MSTSQPAVSIHPYFKVHAGKMPEVLPLLREFVAKTSTEPKALSYEFTVNGDVVFCREFYADADGALAHLANVGPSLERMMALSDVIRLEIHGPAAELEKLKAPLGGFNPVWFTYECGMHR